MEKYGIRILPVTLNMDNVYEGSSENIKQSKEANTIIGMFPHPLRAILEKSIDSPELKMEITIDIENFKETGNIKTMISHLTFEISDISTKGISDFGENVESVVTFKCTKYSLGNKAFDF